MDLTNRVDWFAGKPRSNGMYVFADDSY